MPWRHEPSGECCHRTAFASPSTFHECFFNSIETKKETYFLFNFFFRKFHDERKIIDKNVNYLLSRHQYVNSSFLLCVSIESRRKILNQSARIVVVLCEQRDVTWAMRSLLRLSQILLMVCRSCGRKNKIMTFCKKNAPLCSLTQHNLSQRRCEGILEIWSWESVL